MRIVSASRRAVAFGLIAVSFVAYSVAQQPALGDSPDGMWVDMSGSDLTTLPAKSVPPDTIVHPTVYRPMWLDEALLDDVLGAAPLENLGEPDQAAKSGLSIWLPMPDGTNVEFAFVESRIMEPGLAAKFPEIRTYVGHSLDGRNLHLRFDRTPAGFHALVLGEETAYIDPYTQEGAYVSYAAKNYRAKDNAGCAVADSPVEEKAGMKALIASDGDMYRTYILAVACTGEYANFHGAVSNETQGNAAAAIVTTVNRVTAVYESELAIRFTLVGSEDMIIYVDPTSDPFPSNPTIEQLHAQSQVTINSVIGAGAYNIGHTFAKADLGGLATAGVCNDATKALGVTTSPSPIGDPYDVDYVAHEIGHQFGATHTFNSTKGGCKDNRTMSTAYERGAGVTIMSYAGLCGADNVQRDAFPNFHSESLRQIQNFVLTKTSCQVSTPTGNTGPTVVAGPDYTIPKQTAFTLTASGGSDSEGDTILYSWEERDLGKAQTISAPDNGKSPLFRDFAPTSDAFRTFPELELILHGHQNGDPMELLPTKARTMTFWVVARDSKGGIGSDETSVTVDAVSGPFKVLYPNTAVTIKGGRKKNVTWDVAKTTQSPVGAANVKILLSTDGGQTFPVVLKGNTPNDGQEKIKFPKMATTAGRVKIQGVNNIFFDHSDTNFTIKADSFNLVGTWNSSASTQVAASVFTFSSDNTYVRCFPPPSTDCFNNGVPRPWSFVPDDVFEELPWKLTYGDEFRRCRILDNNTVEAYLTFPDHTVIYYTTFTRQ